MCRRTLKGEAHLRTEDRRCSAGPREPPGTRSQREAHRASKMRVKQVRRFDGRIMEGDHCIDVRAKFSAVTPSAIRSSGTLSQSAKPRSKHGRGAFPPARLHCNLSDDLM